MENASDRVANGKAGETIADVYDLTVPPDMPPGPYRLLVILKVGRAELGTVQL